MNTKLHTYHLTVVNFDFTGCVEQFLRVINCTGQNLPELCFKESHEKVDFNILHEVIECM